MKRALAVALMLSSTAAWAQIRDPYPAQQAPLDPYDAPPPQGAVIDPYAPQPPGQAPYYPQQPYYPPYGYTPPPGGYYPYPPPVVAPQPCPLPPPPPRRAHGKPFFQVSLGYAYRWALNGSFDAAAGEIAFGGEGERAGGGARFGLEVGRTRVGLPYEVITSGGLFVFKLGSRLRVGFGPSVSVLIIERATQSSDNFWTFNFGGVLDLAVDLYKSPSGGSLFLAARAGYDFLVPVDDSLSPNSFVSRLWLGWRI